MSSTMISRLPCPTCGHRLVSVVEDGASWYYCLRCKKPFMYHDAEFNRHLLEEIEALIGR